MRETHYCAPVCVWGAGAEGRHACTRMYACVCVCWGIAGVAKRGEVFSPWALLRPARPAASRRLHAPPGAARPHHPWPSLLALAAASASPPHPTPRCAAPHSTRPCPPPPPGAPLADAEPGGVKEVNSRLISQRDLPEFEPVPLCLADLVAEGMRLVAEQELVNTTKLGEEYMVRGGGKGGGGTKGRGQRLGLLCVRGEGGAA